MIDSYETDALLGCAPPPGREIREALALLKRARLLPEDCACFTGMCRGGDVVDGKLANGLSCKFQSTAVDLDDGHEGSTPD